MYSFFIIFRDRSNGKIDRIAVTLQVKQRELAAAVGRWLTLYNFPNNPYYYILVYGKAFPFLIYYFVYFIRRFDFIKEKQKKTKQKMGVD